MEAELIRDELNSARVSIAYIEVRLPPDKFWDLELAPSFEDPRSTLRANIDPTAWP